MTPQTAVMILGMHRSGTSCLAGSLQQRGLHLGEVFERNPANPKGNRENPAIMRLNDLVLARNGGSWREPPPAIRWDAELARARDAIIDRFVAADRPVWGFKDPRSLLLLDFWLEGLGSHRIAFVGSFRHPWAVASSLQSRDGLPAAEGLALWALYNERLLDLVRGGADVGLVCFDADAREYARTLDRVADRLGLPPTAPAAAFFEESLRHEAAPPRVELPATVAAVYDRLVALYRDQASAAREA